MIEAADILQGLDAPAAVLSHDGAVMVANALYPAVAVPRLEGLRPGERLETPTEDGGSLIWRARALPDGARLVVAEPGVLSGPSTRERYLAALSHELRTPLNGVLGMAGLLGRTRLDADQKSYVDALRDSGEHLLSLVNDVLDLAKLESGQLDLDPQPADLEKLLQGVAELLSPRAYERGLEIAWSVAAGLPCVMADEGRLRQILFNLAGNAVKFTDRGGVLLDVSGVDGDDGRIRLRFGVRDTGPGVPDVDQARIFDEFARLEPQQRLEGAGLGLAIVRRLAQAHGGSVGLANHAEGGAEFWFEADFEPAATARPERALARITVAVISPSPIVLDGARRQVEACGGVALTFANLEAAEAAPQGAIFLIDHGMKPQERPPMLRRCIVLLAPEERGAIARCRKAGFSGYLIKPLRRASLAERVLAVAERRRAPRAPAALRDERASAETGMGLRVLLAEDNPINALLARTHLHREGCTVDVAVNGQAAVEAAVRKPYDLILMDLRMPVLDGQRATMALRAQGVRVPVVALTADAFEDDRKACLAAGMNGFLTKPLDSAALRAVLAKWAGFTAGKPEARLAS